MVIESNKKHRNRFAGNRRSYAMENLECIFESGRKICYIFTFYCLDSVFHFFDVVGSSPNLIKSGEGERVS